MNTKKPFCKLSDQGFEARNGVFTLHNNKLCNKAPKMTKVDNYPTIKEHGYEWVDKSVDKMWTSRNNARRYKLAQIQKALRTMLNVDASKPYLSFEQREHIRRTLYINQKELDYRTQIKRA